MTPLERRIKAVNETQLKFANQSFKWGGGDCAKMMAFHLRKFGHKVPKTGGYRSAITAKKHLLKLGFETFPDLIDSLGLTSISPAFTLVGDIVSFASDDVIGGTGIVHGNGNMLAFHENYLTPVIMSMNKVDRAWKVI